MTTQIETAIDQKDRDELVDFSVRLGRHCWSVYCHSKRGFIRVFMLPNDEVRCRANELFQLGFSARMLICPPIGVPALDAILETAQGETAWESYLDSADGKIVLDGAAYPDTPEVVLRYTEATTPCFSKDLQLLEIDLDILTVLPKDRAALVYANVGMEYLEQVKPRVYEILKQEVSKYSAELVIENRGKIHQDVLETARSRMEDLVRFEDIVLTNIDFSDAYEKAIEEKQVAQQDSLKSRYELEKAKIEAEKQIATAQGEAESIRIKGEALKNSPGMAFLEAVKKWNGVVPHTILLGNEVPAVLPVK